MPISQDYLHFPGSVTIEEVLQAYLDRDGQWWWLLVTEREGENYICSFGSLLPYLTGRTPHIVHSIGDCAICSSMDPLLWSDTGVLVEEALADEGICRRLVSSLPMAELPVVDVQSMEESQIEIRLVIAGNVCGVMKNGVLCGVHILQMKGDLGGLPDF